MKSFIVPVMDQVGEIVRVEIIIIPNEREEKRIGHFLEKVKEKGLKVKGLRAFAGKDLELEY